MTEPWYQEYQDLLLERGMVGLDLETTGVGNFAYERPTSAAVLGLDENMGSPEIIIDNKCRLPAHILPSAVALEISNINPIDLMKEELSLYGLISKLADYFIAHPNKILTTYNGAFYDLIILRHSFFSSLYNPYLLLNAFEDRLHIDLYKMAQTIFCFEPNSIAFFKDQTGKVILKQEAMARENGIDPGDAHTALDDVKALLKLADLFRRQAPDIFFAGIASGNKKRTVKLMTEQLFFNYGEVKYKERQAVKRTPTFICEDPSVPNRMIFFDLCSDPEDYLYMTAEEIAALINKKNSPLFSIKSNGSPVILPPLFCSKNALTEEEATYKATKIQENNGFKENVYLACDINSKRRRPWTVEEYPESQIYNDFIDNSNRMLSDAFRKTQDFDRRLDILNEMSDPRLIDFAKRILATENPDCTPELLKDYHEFEANRLLDEEEVPWRTLKKAWDSLVKAEQLANDDLTILAATKKYYKLIENKMR